VSIEATHLTLFDIYEELDVKAFVEVVLGI
jgi:hypothetical protein